MFTFKPIELIVIGFCLILIGLSNAFAPQPVGAIKVKVPSTDLGYYFRDNLKELEFEINLDRVVNPLARDERLDCAAYLRGKDLVTNSYWSHVSPVGFNSQEAVNFCSPSHPINIGENLAKDLENKTIVSAWMSSKSHKDVLLDQKFKKIGLARYDNIVVAILSD